MELGSQINIMGDKFASLSSASCVSVRSTLFRFICTSSSLRITSPLVFVDIVDHVADVGDRWEGAITFKGCWAENGDLSNYYTGGRK